MCQIKSNVTQSTRSCFSQNGDPQWVLDTRASLSHFSILSNHWTRNSGFPKFRFILYVRIEINDNLPNTTDMKITNTFLDGVLSGPICQ
jgi:hypothetical protein